MQRSIHIQHIPNPAHTNAHKVFVPTAIDYCSSDSGNPFESFGMMLGANCAFLAVSGESAAVITLYHVDFQCAFVCVRVNISQLLV